MRLAKLCFAQYIEYRDYHDGVMPNISKGFAHMIGMPNKTLQTILIPKSFGLHKARQWLKTHSYDYENFRKTKNFYRFMQNLDIAEANYYTVKLPDGIELVYQEYYA